MYETVLHWIEPPKALLTSDKNIADESQGLQQNWEQHLKKLNPLPTEGMTRLGTTKTMTEKPRQSRDL
jgi:hypothetical protein